MSDMCECNDVWFYEQAIKFVNYPGAKSPEGLNYIALSLAGEVGELLNKIKKIIRDDDGMLLPDRKDAIIGECGDIRWCVAALCYELDINHSNAVKMGDGIMRQLFKAGQGDIFQLTIFAHALASRSGALSTAMVSMLGGKGVPVAGYIGQICEALDCIEQCIGVDSNVVRLRSIEKFADRTSRGVLGGEGDNR